jgi:hypoxanthine phosphoribosyltransferase
MIESKLGECVFTSVEIETRVKQISTAISQDYAEKRPLIISILRGAIFFTVDLTRSLAIPFDLDFMSISSFKTGFKKVEIEKDITEEVADRDVIIVEDIIDTGLTLNFLMHTMEKRFPASIVACTFLDCPDRRFIEVPVHYSCFEIPDIYVVGYGLDFRGDYRNLLEVYTLHDTSGRSTQILKHMGKGGPR